MSGMTSLQLNRTFHNAQFQSWKIGNDFVVSRGCYDLPAYVYEGASDAVDYVHTRASVLRNHLIQSQGRHFVVTHGDEDTIAVIELFQDRSAGSDSAKLQLRQVAVLPKPQQDTLVGQAIEASLHSSLAVVAPAANNLSAPEATDCSLLLASRGGGDLTLIKQRLASDGLVSNIVYPLRPPPPAVGVKPFTIEAAWMNSSGHIRCVLAAITSTSGSSSSNHPPHTHPKWVCDTWLVTLTTTLQPQQQQQQQQQGVSELVLQVLDCQLLLMSSSPPAAAVGGAAANGSEQLLLVGEPALEEDELPQGFLSAMSGAPRESTSAVSAAASGLPADAAATAAAVAADEDLDDMDLDPRTLQQAAARLAQFTSEQQLGDLPQQQWTDVFKESGPGDLGAAETEPAVDIMLFATAAADAQGHGSSSSSGRQEGQNTAAAACGSSIDARPQQLQLISAVSCGPHRLLAVQELLKRCYNSPKGLMLGFTDDVDCAVVAATLPQQQSAEVQSAATADTSAVSVVHNCNLPALAYVVAGKTQRRHLLLGGPSSPVAAVLVEGRQYAYLYGQVAAGDMTGQQQIVNMELPTGSHILGAQLLVKQLNDDSKSVASRSSRAPTDQGMPGSPATAHLLLLTPSCLIVYTLKAPQ